jgi:YcxB-like protein
MSSPVPIKYRITEDDYASAVRFHAWRGFIARPSTTTLVAGGITVVLLGFILWTEPLLLAPLAFVVAVFAILVAFGLLVRVPNRARQHYRQYKGMDEPLTVELTDAGLKFSNADAEGTVPWSKILQWRQNDRFILIYRMPIMFHIVPKSIARHSTAGPTPLLSTSARSVRLRLMLRARAWWDEGQ